MPGPANTFTLEVLLSTLRGRLGSLDFDGAPRTDGTGPDTMPLIFLDPLHTAECAAARAVEWIEVCDEEEGEPSATSRDVLLARLLEAFSVDEPGPLQDRLLQVAAVAVQWAYAIEERTQQVLDAERAVMTG